jgi:hypothetical protein
VWGCERGENICKGSMEEKRQLAEDFGRRWENDTTTDVMEIIWNGVD